MQKLEPEQPLPLATKFRSAMDELVSLSESQQKVYDWLMANQDTFRTIHTLIQENPVLLSHGTSLACTKCGRLEAPAYYLKHSHGRYAVLCFSNGEGCWEHSSRANCSYIDQHMAQCMELAEWAVAYGPDMLQQREVCAVHVPAVLTDVSEHRVFPLKD